MAAEVILRQRVCRCGTTFYICRSCDRGQRYCSEPCRQKARREQRREANRRHQKSLEGRLDHRDRQQLYRERRLRFRRVTDQGSFGSRCSVTMPRETRERKQPPPPALDSSLAVCVRCGRAGYGFGPEVDVSQTPEALPQPTQQEYVAAVLRAYVALPETLPRWHRADRGMALELFRRRIPLERIETAFVLGSARRLGRDPKLIVPPIRSMAYFLPVIEEVLTDPPPCRYIQYLRVVHVGPAQKTKKSNTTT